MSSLHLRIPATSANLGPGFDALGLAMALYLRIDAVPAEQPSLTATGRQPELTGKLEGNIIFGTYRELAPAGPQLALRVENEIPLGMGCGSSAAALVAGVALANHFGGLQLSRAQILTEAARREGHPDNVAACVEGGLTCSAFEGGGTVVSASLGAGLGWRLLLVLPPRPLATSSARAVLPGMYSREDAVHNVQATALLLAAFALGRPELLKTATSDRMHQPSRAALCPLLPSLLPLAGEMGVYSVTLSGAGPAVLLMVDPAAPLAPIHEAIRSRAGELVSEILETSIAGGATWTIQPDGR